MKEKIAFGVDFGTTNSIAAAWGEDVRRHEASPFPFWDTSEGRKRPHASVVWYSPESKVIVGNEGGRRWHRWAERWGIASLDRSSES